MNRPMIVVGMALIMAFCGCSKPERVLTAKSGPRPYSPGMIEYASWHDKGRVLFKNIQEVATDARDLNHRSNWAEPVLRFSKAGKVKYVEAWPFVYNYLLSLFENAAGIQKPHRGLHKQLEKICYEFGNDVMSLYEEGFCCDTFPDAKGLDQVLTELKSVTQKILSYKERCCLVNDYFTALLIKASDVLVKDEALRDEIFETKSKAVKVFLEADMRNAKTND